MRAILVGVASLVAVQTASAQILAYEPHYLRPRAVVFVDNRTCPAGRVLKVTGTWSGLSRKKVCVLLRIEQVAFGRIEQAALDLRVPLGE